MDFQTAVACGVLFLYGKGNLEEKAAMFGVRYSTFHRMAHMVIDELISSLKRGNLHPQTGGPGLLEMRPDKTAIHRSTVRNRRYSL